MGLDDLIVGVNLITVGLVTALYFIVELGVVTAATIPFEHLVIILLSNIALFTAMGTENGPFDQ